MDELHLFVYPLTIAAGTTLFDEDAPVKLSFVGPEARNNGVVYLRISLSRSSRPSLRR